eukprot:jgi/Bigna1/88691/estExt_fgenesh1_pg.C_360111
MFSDVLRFELARGIEGEQRRVRRVPLMDPIEEWDFDLDAIRAIGTKSLFLRLPSESGFLHFGNSSNETSSKDGAGVDSSSRKREKDGSSGAAGWGVSSYLSNPRLPSGMSLPSALSSMLGGGDSSSGGGGGKRRNIVGNGTGGGSDEFMLQSDQKQGGNANDSNGEQLQEIHEGGSYNDEDNGRFLAHSGGYPSPPAREQRGQEQQLGQAHSSSMPQYISETKAVTNSPHHLVAQVNFQRDMLAERDDRINQLKQKLKILKRATKQLVQNNNNNSSLSGLDKGAGATAAQNRAREQLKAELKASKMIVMAKDNRISELKKTIDTMTESLQQKEESQVLLVRKNIELQQDLYREKQFIKRFERTRAKLNQKPTVKSSLWTSALDVVTGVGGGNANQNDPEVLRVIGKLREKNVRMKEQLRKRDETIGEIQRRYEKMMERNRGDRRAMMEMEQTMKELESKCSAVANSSAAQLAEMQQKHTNEIELMRQEHVRIKARHEEDTNDLANEYKDEIDQWKERLQKQKHQAFASQRRLAAAFQVEKDDLNAKVEKANNEAVSTKQMLETLKEGFQTQRTNDEAKLVVKEKNISRLQGELETVSSDLDVERKKTARLEGDVKSIKNNLEEALAASQALERDNALHLRRCLAVARCLSAIRAKRAAFKSLLSQGRGLRQHVKELQQQANKNAEELKAQANKNAEELKAQAKKDVEELKAQAKKDVEELNARHAARLQEETERIASRKNDEIDDVTSAFEQKAKALKDAADNERQQQKEALELSRATAEQRLSESNARCVQLETKLEETGSALEDAKEQLKALQERLHHNASLSNEHAQGLKLQLEDSQRKLAETMGTVESLERALEDEREASQQLTSMRDKAKAEAAQAVAESEAAEATTKEAVGALEAKCSFLEEQATNANQEVQRLRGYCVEKDDKVSHVQKELKEAEEGLSACRKEIEALKAKEEEGRQIIDRYQTEVKSLRAEIDAIAQGDAEKLSTLSVRRTEDQRKEIESMRASLIGTRQQLETSEKKLQESNVEAASLREGLQAAQAQCAFSKGKLQAIKRRFSTVTSKLCQEATALRESSSTNQLQIGRMLEAATKRAKDAEEDFLAKTERVVRMEETAAQDRQQLVMQAEDAREEQERLQDIVDRMEEDLRLKDQQSLSLQRQKLQEMQEELEAARRSEQEKAKQHFEQQFRTEMKKMRQRFEASSSASSSSSSSSSGAGPSAFSDEERVQLLDMFTQEKRRLEKERDNVKKELSETQAHLARMRTSARKWRDKAKSMRAATSTIISPPAPSSSSAAAAAAAAAVAASSLSSSSISNNAGAKSTAMSSKTGMETTDAKNYHIRADEDNTGANDDSKQRPEKGEGGGDGERSDGKDAEGSSIDHSSTTATSTTVEDSPTGPSTSSPSTLAAQSPPLTEEKVRKRLVAMFKKYNPSKLSNIDRLLEKFKGRERELLAAVRSKYENGGGKGGKASSSSSQQQDGSWLGVGGLGGTIGGAVGGLNNAVTSGLNKMFTF